MRMKKIAVALSALAMVVSPVVAKELDGTLKKVKDQGYITIGHRESSVPFSYYDDNQKVVGYAMDICMHIVDAVKKEIGNDKLEVKLTPVSSATRIPLMANGTVDLECGSTTNNLERQQQVAFTNSHFLTASKFVAKADAKLKTIDDLKGRTVVSTSGTVNIKQLMEINTARNLGINVVPAKDHAEGFLMVETGRADAFVMDDILLASLVANSKTPDAYAISDEAFSNPEPYGIMMRRDDPAFKAVVDKATADLYKSADMKGLYDKWFNAPIPPKGLNLKVPLSPALAKAFAHPSDSGKPEDYK